MLPKLQIQFSAIFVLFQLWLLAEDECNLCSSEMSLEGRIAVINITNCNNCTCTNSLQILLSDTIYFIVGVVLPKIEVNNEKYHHYFSSYHNYRHFPHPDGQKVCKEFP